jgi:exopolysaccharide production protein ExoY
MESATKPVSYSTPRPLMYSKPSPLGGWLKRLFDLSGALTGLVVLCPLILLIAVLVKLSDGGPIFFKHRRVGHSGRIFGCVKFRTMVAGGDAILEDYFNKNPAEKEVWSRERKLQSDPRVTKLGSFLRKSSLDELPQLINILKGEMSIVGPRPIISDEIPLYGAAVSYYLISRPGLTGLWQVSGRNDSSYAQRVEMDRHYVANWSLSSDIIIILRTIPAVCLSRGSY